MTLQRAKSAEVTFVFEGVPAKSVFVAGDFNQWDPSATKMTKSKDGSFKAKVKLAPGQHQYKFVADGTWIEDRDAPIKIQNAFGTINSAVEV